MERSEKTSRLVEEIRVLNSRGEALTVEKWQDFTRFAKLNGSWSDWAPAGFSLSLNGEHVNATKDPKVLQAFDTDELLTIIPEGPSSQ